MTAQLDEEDPQEEHEANDIGHEARLDEQEAADDEDDALGQIAGVGEVTDECRGERHHADDGRNGRADETERRRIDHEQYRREHEHVWDDEGRDGKLRGIDTRDERVAARDAGARESRECNRRRHVGDD